ncbi:DUF2934 domain-containing protein [Prosthecobacter sp.]|uniref:DUF2934 domain-containing protein n=1 Tax=Prosthecobacter sp. TaxID=1965333 RepID=UPI002AB9E475|nr:DUF2934 domain-containing protein [Prosthecobacter sp.]MDZ4404693.1 DUF2934 domain-containing protein [Prosthecobacter sp.]
MKKPTLPVPPPPFEPIHARAYHLWQQANRPTGQDVDFWLQAEQQVKTQPQASKTASIKKPRSAKATPTAAKANPQAALTFKSATKSGLKRSTKPPTR